MDYTKYNAKPAQNVVYDEGLRSYMMAIFNYMAAALAVTGLVAYLSYDSHTMLALMYNMNESGRMTGLSGLGWIIALSPLALVFVFSMKIQSMSTDMAKLLFGVYAVLMGLSLSSIFIVYTTESIARTFFICSAVFAGMSLYGYTTKKDLTGFGSFLIMGLFGVIIASLVNMFLHSSGLNFALSVVGVLIFTGLTAYDVQKLKRMYSYNFQDSGMDITKLAIMGALNLYMDFINLFLYMLRFFGDRRSN